MEHTEDFYAFGYEAGQAWQVQYQESYADTYLEHLVSEMQRRRYHLVGNRFPGEIISAWQRGFWDGARAERE